MKEIKFLHCADIHLDAPFSSLGLKNGKSSIRRQDLKETFSNIIEIAQKEQVDIVLISGDLFEHEYVKKSTITFVNDMFKNISHINVFIMPGNHDPYIVNSFYNVFDWNKNVHILNNKTKSVILEDKKVCVHGIGFDGRIRSLKEEIGTIDLDYINFALVHGTIDMNFKKKQYNYINSKEAEALDINYWAFGHFHNKIMGIGEKNNIFNPGSPEPLGFDEVGKHGVFVGKIKKGENFIESKNEIKINFVHTNKRFYENLSINVSDCHTDEQIIIKILDKLENKDKEFGLYSIVINGFLDERFKPDLQNIHRYFEDQFFFIKFKDETLLQYNFEEIMAEPGLRGMFVKKMLDTISNASDEKKKKMLEKSLYLGLQAIDSGKIEE